MKKIFLTVIIASSIFISCGETDNYKPLEPISNLQYIKNAKKFEDVFVLVDSLDLKCPEISFSDPSRCFKVNKGRIVFSIEGTKSKVVIFDSLGNQKTVISKKGQGPGEFVNLRKFDIDDYYIYVYDMSQNKIIIYNYDGSFIASMKIKNRYASMTVSDQKIYLRREAISDKKYDTDIIDVYDFTGKYLESIEIPVFNDTNRHLYMHGMDFKLLVKNNIIYIVNCEDYFVYAYNLEAKKLLYHTDFIPSWVKVQPFDTKLETREEQKKWMAKNNYFYGLYFHNDLIMLNIIDGNMQPCLILYDKNGNYLTNFRAKGAMFESENEKFYKWGAYDTKSSSEYTVIKMKIFKLKKTIED